LYSLGWLAAGLFSSAKAGVWVVAAAFSPVFSFLLPPLQADGVSGQW
jgi:hypothetical protein